MAGCPLRGAPTPLVTPGTGSNCPESKRTGDTTFGSPPAYCMAGAGSRLRISQRNKNTAVITNSAIIMKFATPSPIPKCDNIAARPMPAASPAIGPSQRLIPGFAAAAAGAAALVVAFDGAAFCVGAAGGAAWRGAVRVMPNDLPPPSRAACALLAVRPKVNANATRPSKNLLERFM